MEKQAIITLTTKEEQLKEKQLVKIKNNKINYLEQNKTTVLFEQEKKVLIRENEEIYMELFFQEEKGNIYIKSLRNNIELAIKTKKIDITKNKIVIQYEMDKNDYLYEIEMED